MFQYNIRILTEKGVQITMERLYQYDVVVVGGGTAGVSAAVGAAKTGAKTLLILAERRPIPGSAPSAAFLPAERIRFVSLRA